MYVCMHVCRSHVTCAVVIYIIQLWLVCCAFIYFSSTQCCTCLIISHMATPHTVLTCLSRYISQHELCMFTILYIFSVQVKIIYKYHEITGYKCLYHCIRVYTCNTSVLLWWLYEGLCGTIDKYTCNLKSMYIHSQCLCICMYVCTV